MDIRRRLEALETALTPETAGPSAKDILKAKLDRLAGRLEPMVVPCFGDDDHVGPPGEYRQTLPDGREYLCQVVEAIGRPIGDPQD